MSEFSASATVNAAKLKHIVRVNAAATFRSVSFSILFLAVSKFIIGKLGLLKVGAFGRPR